MSINCQTILWLDNVSIVRGAGEFSSTWIQLIKIKKFQNSLHRCHFHLFFTYILIWARFHLRGFILILILFATTKWVLINFKRIEKHVYLQLEDFQPCLVTKLGIRHVNQLTQIILYHHHHHHHKITIICN